MTKNLWAVKPNCFDCWSGAYVLPGLVVCFLNPREGLFLIVVDKIKEIKPNPGGRGVIFFYFCFDVGYAIFP